MIAKSLRMPEKIGRIHTVKSYAGILTGIISKIDGPAWVLDDNNDLPWDERCLMRIDDGANLEDKETQREKSWNQ